MAERTSGSEAERLAEQQTIPPVGGGAGKLAGAVNGLADQQTVAPRVSQTATVSDQASGGQAEIPKSLGRYRIEEVLGKGAMGAVYLAHDSELNRKVALKTPLGPLAQGEEFLERFRREAQAAAILRHPNICPIYDVGEIDGVHHISMAFIAGSPLSSYVNPDDPLDIRRAVMIVRKVASAIAEAHRHDIIHRDLKPANIMIDGKGEPIVMDFGLARIEQPQGEQLTQDGMAMGSPAYMSPEQFEGKAENIGAACDIYSLGVVLYELLTGTLPFRGSMLQIMAQVLKERTKPPSLVRPEIDETLDAICLKMINREADSRFGSMKAVVGALTKYLKGELKKPASPKREPDPAPVETDEWEYSEPARPSRRPSRRRKQKGIRIAGKRVSAGLLTAGGATAVLLAGILWVVFGGGSEHSEPPPGPSGDTLAADAPVNDDDPDNKNNTVIVDRADIGESTAGMGIPGIPAGQADEVAVPVNELDVPVNELAVPVDESAVPVNEVAAPANNVAVPNLADAILLFNFEPESYFEDNGKYLVRDLSGLGNHGEMHGPSSTEHGKAGAGLLFDGRDDYIQLPLLSDDLLRSTTELTLATWFLVGNANRSNFLLDVRSHDGRTTVLRLLANIEHRLQFHPGSDELTVTTDLSGQWHHLAVTWGGELRRIFLDGKPIAERLGSKAPIASTSVPVLSRIGGQSNSSTLRGPKGENRALSGTLDEYILLKRAMSEEEIGQLYQLGTDGVPLPGNAAAELP